MIDCIALSHILSTVISATKKKKKRYLLAIHGQNQSNILIILIFLLLFFFILFLQQFELHKFPVGSLFWLSWSLRVGAPFLGNAILLALPKTCWLSIICKLVKRAHCPIRETVYREDESCSVTCPPLQMIFKVSEGVFFYLSQIHRDLKLFQVILPIVCSGILKCFHMFEDFSILSISQLQFSL